MLLLLAILSGPTSEGQQNSDISIEHQVADTACLCLSKLDSVGINVKANALKNECLSQAIQKNQEAINKNFETKKRKEEEIGKIGVRGSILIKVQNVLSNSCPQYAILEKKAQVQRQMR
jgi:hypothetical protein